MYKINSSFQYIHHYISTKDIAKAVRDDLASRENCSHPERMHIEDKGDEPGRWDPGGMVCISDDKYTFKLCGIDIEVYRQHIGMLVHWVNKAKLRDWYEVKYYKVHSGYLSCLCLTPIEYEQLKKELSSEDVLRQGALGANLRQSAIEASGIIQAVRVKNEFGEDKILKVKIEPKVLN